MDALVKLSGSLFIGGLGIVFTAFGLMFIILMIDEVIKHFK